MVVRCYFVKKKLHGELSHIDEVSNEVQIVEDAIKKINEVLHRIWPQGASSSELWKVCDLIVALLRAGQSTADRNAAQAQLERKMHNGQMNTKELKEIVEKKLDEIVEKMGELNSVPADPRPGLNVYGLVMHQLLTSALAVAWYDSTNQNSSEERVAFRLAALAYVLGRPGSLKIDCSKSVERLRSLTRGIVDSSILERATAILLGKDGYETLQSHIIAASRAAVSYELVEEEVKRLLKSDSEHCLDDERLWKDLDVEKIKILSELYVTGAYDRGSIEQVRRAPRNEEGPISFLLCDSSGIQHFIENTDRLIQLKAASLLLDGFMKDHPDLREKGLPTLYSALQQLGPPIPIEAVIMAGGGNMVLIVATARASETAEGIRQCFAETVVGVRLYTVIQAFSLDDKNRTPLMSHYKTLHSAMAEIKNDLMQVGPVPIWPGLEMRCESCGERPAMESVPIGDDTRLYCRECKTLHEFGNEYSFKKKYNKYRDKNSSSFDVEWDGLSLRVMEFIAGDPLEPPKDKKSENDLALIKADGNLAGDFIANARTIAELLEKSMLMTSELEYAVKDAFDWITELVEKTVAATGDGMAKRESDQLRARLEMGRMYIGGDDLLMLCPSAFAIQLAVKIGLLYSERMGRALSISFGIITFPPQQPIRLVMKTAESLLRQSKQKFYREFRENMNRQSESKQPDGKLPCAVIDFELLKGSLESPSQVEKVHKEWSKNGVIHRPIFISDDLGPVLKTLASLNNQNASSMGRDAIIDELVRLSVQHQVDPNKERYTGLSLKDFLSAATEIVEQMDIPLPPQQYDKTENRSGFTLSIYMAAREKERPKELYYKIASLIFNETDRMGLIDAIVAARIMMGS